MPLLGSFDPAFLEVPREVIQLTMRTNQKYFACTDGEGALAPNFVCTANIEATDGGASIVQGNERVLSARLSDAKFFWEQDLKVPLEEQARKLGDIVFHEKLGTVADKVERVAKLARWLVEEGIVGKEPLSPGGRGQGEGVLSSRAPSEAAPPHPDPLPAGEREELADLADRAARLCKADLVTQMVGEFPELQGLIGGHLARAQGEPDAIADAIRDHYKPVGQGDEVPTAPVTVAVSLADKLDTLSAFFGIDGRPSGSRDPFALRRAALATIQLIIANDLRLSLFDVLWSHKRRVDAPHVMLPSKLVGALGLDLIKALGGAAPEKVLDELLDKAMERADEFNTELVKKASQQTNALLDFFADRLKVQQREAGVRHDLIDAVFALGGEDDLVRLLARVKALQAFVETPEGADLLTGYKRAANILKRENWGREQEANKTLAYAPEKEETALIAALDSAEPRARAAVEAEDFEGAMAALASLRAPVDSFFDKVTVNDPDPAKREARLALLARMRDAVHRVADFARIEG